MFQIFIIFIIFFIQISDLILLDLIFITIIFFFIQIRKAPNASFIFFFVFLVSLSPASAQDSAGEKNHYVLEVSEDAGTGPAAPHAQAQAHEGTGSHVALGEVLPLFSCIPFACMLLSIALLPLIAANIWHHHFGKIAAFWAASMALPFIYAYKGTAIHEILHIILADYVPFIILLGALFTVSGGILLKGTLRGTPLVNTGIILIGTLLASWMGTTGAAMLMIRPLLRANDYRKNKTFMVVFFIFLVANIGGAMTPLGDPPLFLGFLHGVRGAAAPRTPTKFCRAEIKFLLEKLCQKSIF